MIFNKYYDRTLWIMLSSNKRQRILDFVNNIPKGLLKKIQSSLEMYQLFLFGLAMDKENIQLSGSIKTNGDMLYEYYINKDTGILNIKEYILDEEEKYRKFEINIYPFKDGYNKKLGNLDTYYLGNIYYNFMEEYDDETCYLIDYEKVDFDLMKIPFNKYVLCLKQKFPVFKDNGDIVNDIKNKYSFVDVKDIPYSVNREVLNRKYTRSRRKF